MERHNLAGNMHKQKDLSTKISHKKSQLNSSKSMHHDVRKSYTQDILKYLMYSYD